jgi:hypothetical protein
MELFDDAKNQVVPSLPKAGVSLRLTRFLVTASSLMEKYLEMNEMESTHEYVLLFYFYVFTVQGVEPRSFFNYYSYVQAQGLEDVRQVFSH